MVRSLKSGGLWHRISSLNVFFYSEWDKQTFDKTKLKLRLEEEDKITFLEMYGGDPSDSAHDIVVCTYVSPWAFHPEEDPGKQKKFRSFLKESLKVGGLLVSVDPERDRYL